jgi:hypothetical protein
MADFQTLWFQKEAATLEESRVRLILQEFGLQDWTVALRHEEHCHTGEEARLSFTAFDTVFPGFPIYLEARPLYALADHSTCSQTALFRNFHRYLPYRQFEEVLNSAAERAGGRPVGLLYRWPGITYGLILHNGDFLMRDFVQTMPLGNGQVTVCHFRRFVRTLAVGEWTLESLRAPWKPDESLRAPPKPGNDAWQIPSPLTLAQLIPDKAEHRLLALLLEILFAMPPDERRKYIVRRGGERWVAVTQERLAKRLGCCVRNVQRAVKGLEDRGMIEPRRGPSGNNEMRVIYEALP